MSLWRTTDRRQSKKGHLQVISHRLMDTLIHQCLHPTTRLFHPQCNLNYIHLMAQLCLMHWNDQEKCHLENMMTIVKVEIQDDIREGDQVEVGRLEGPEIANKIGTTIGLLIKDTSCVIYSKAKIWRNFPYMAIARVHNRWLH